MHSALIEEDGRFKLYGYAEMRSEEELRDPSNRRARREVARDFEETIRAISYGQ